MDTTTTAAGIAYQNKDILMKNLAKYYQGKSFEALGVKLPKIKALLPTDLSTVLAKELRLDNLFELEDGSILLVDYESAYKKVKLVEYLMYVSLVVNDYLHQHGKICTIHVLIIYTADLQSAPHKLDLGSVQMEVQQVFLSNLNSSEIYAGLLRKVEANGPLTDEDLIRFSLLPLTEPEKEKKQALIEKAVDLAKCVKDEDQKIFLLANILVATDKFIEPAYAEQLKGWISMTKVSRLFEEEKNAAVKEVKQESQKIIAKIQQQSQQEKLEQQRQFEEQQRQRDQRMVEEMLLDGEGILKIMKYTRLPKAVILQIQQELGLQQPEGAFV